MSKTFTDYQKGFHRGFEVGMEYAALSSSAVDISPQCLNEECGRQQCHMGPCVKEPKEGVMYTDGLGSLGCGSWPRNANGKIDKLGLASGVHDV